MLSVVFAFALRSPSALWLWLAAVAAAVPSCAQSSGDSNERLFAETTGAKQLT